jgi:AcrR family transcriptional regulator
MARTLNREVHMVRRDAFIDAAQRLMQFRGWEQTSVQDVLDELEASRGAFYHYFDSKQALLEAVIERMVEQALATVEPVVKDPGLGAIEKLQGVFSTIGRWKTDRKQLVLSLLTVWMSDDNAIVREKFRRTMVRRMEPTLAPIIRQGVEEGVFQTASPDQTAHVFVMLLLGLQDIATEVFLDRQAGRIELADVERTFASYAEAFERVLGAPAGSIKLIDRPVLRAWFG